MGLRHATESLEGGGTTTGRIVLRHHEAIDVGIAAGIVAGVVIMVAGEADRDLLMDAVIDIEAQALVEILTTTFLFPAVLKEMFQMSR